MKVLSIVLKPQLSDGVYTVEGNIVVDSAPIAGAMKMKIELELDLIGPVAAIRGSSGNYYSFRAQLKTGQTGFILGSEKTTNSCVEIFAEDIHRFSGFLDDENSG